MSTQLEWNSEVVQYNANVVLKLKEFYYQYAEEWYKYDSDECREFNFECKEFDNMGNKFLILLGLSVAIQILNALTMLKKWEYRAYAVFIIDLIWIILNFVILALVDRNFTVSDFTNLPSEEFSSSSDTNTSNGYCICISMTIITLLLSLSSGFYRNL